MSTTATGLFDQQTGLTKDAPMESALVEHKSAATPMELLGTLDLNNIDTDKVRALIDMQREWQNDRAEEAFSTAMKVCQQAMPVIVRDAKNSQTNSRFAKLENIKKVAKPIYNAHGFALSYGEADCPLPNHKRTICDVRHDAGACHQYHLDLPVDGVGPKGNPIGGMNAVQGCISTTSYGQRILTCMIFDITIADTDDDGQSFSTINEKQLATIEDWMALVEVKPAPFLKWLCVGKMSELPQEKYDMVIVELKRKAQEKGIKVTA